ncbi:MAG: ribokinase [Kiritimatiellia bacterium]|jgi:ribokinase|nr:ribokinase [Kiritimatiellia bacterium]MDP6809292.1 ribokinase [Kiritimatiellia bacterium]MDP7023030.1 ribokinase [Kiritimatiellia bacterium]
MHILNIGSVNIDHVYMVEHFVRPGETLSSTQHDTFAGGKGFNQSIALARAGAPTRHAGRVGHDAAWLLDRLSGQGIDITGIKMADCSTGHAIIQVVPTGENAIVLHSGANASVTAEDIAQAVLNSSDEDILLVQNETSSVTEAIRAGKNKGLKIVFNPAPMSPAVRDYPLHDVDLFILNETEAEGLTGQSTPEDVHAAMLASFPGSATVLTMGRKGAAYLDAGGIITHPAMDVQAVDTTAAGDTFIGYFLSEMIRTGKPDRALALGCHAAAICVTRPGASDSIPFLEEVITEMKTR